MFVRSALGPNTGPGLDVVRLGETSEHREFLTVRSRTRFTPLPPKASLSEQMHFGDPVVLLRAPFRLSFAYAGPDRVWKSAWRDADKLPVMIRLTIRDASTQRIVSISTITPVHVQAPSSCAQSEGCDDKGKDNKDDSDKQDATPGASANPRADIAGQGGTL